MPLGYDYIRDISVEAAVAWFEERTLKCLGPNQPTPDLAEWHCTHEFMDGTTIEARIIGDRQGVAQIIGIASGLSAEDSAGYLGPTAAGIAVDESEHDALSLWAHQRAVGGGLRVFGHGVVVQLQPHSAHRAISITAS
ncbi:MAG: hypothetical protein WED12_04695 [Chloroflexota bacterium]